MTRINRLCSLRDGLYKVHVVTGVAAALWVLLLAVTGVMINHQESLGLLDAEISDEYLPGSYRADVRTGTTRLNIIVTDLHSGRFFGAHGTWLSDSIALFLFVSLASGTASYWIKRRLQRINNHPHKLPQKPSAGRALHPTNGKSSLRMPGKVSEDKYPNSQPNDESRGSHIGTV